MAFDHSDGWDGNGGAGPACRSTSAARLIHGFANAPGANPVARHVMDDASRRPADAPKLRYVADIDTAPGTSAARTSWSTS
jgi:hypothetical protein